ncbi:hypothetical protein FT641_18735 [Bacillus paranthracis]|uniref:hypothetical protein n=1 Tax=Bacillus paranthracis TaxID=2026186 RepID=UPI00187A31A9|nr:hypothetical protein [Bacillus paranthracis]MBE7114399.1 hypothetical protein [Bacillus paranthracis]MBE7154728.1 hypothetical protein [Bacillus paranthracis]
MDDNKTGFQLGKDGVDAIKNACEDANEKLEDIGKNMQWLAKSIGVSFAVTDDLREKVEAKKSFVVAKEYRNALMDVLANKGAAYPHIREGQGVHQYAKSTEEVSRKMQWFFRKYKDEFEWVLVDVDEKTFVWNIDDELKNNHKIDWRELGLNLFIAGVMLIMFAGLVWRYL